LYLPVNRHAEKKNVQLIKGTISRKSISKSSMRPRVLGIGFKISDFKIRTRMTQIKNADKRRFFFLLLCLLCSFNFRTQYKDTSCYSPTLKKQNFEILKLEILEQYLKNSATNISLSMRISVLPDSLPRMLYRNFH